MDENEFWRLAQAAMEKLKIDDEEDEKPKKQKYDKEYAKAYYKQNSEIMKKRNYVYMFKKIKCECGSEMIYGSKYRHMTSQIHKKNLENLLKDKDELSEFNSETS